MNIGGLLAPLAHARRRTIAVATVALLVASFMALGVRPANAVTACQVTGGVMEVTILDGNVTVTISLNAIGRIEVTSSTEGEVDCLGGIPRVTNITEIDVDATAAGPTPQKLVIDMTNGYFQPEFQAAAGTAATEILFTTRLGQQDGVIDDELRLIGRPAASGADQVTAGADGIDLNGDGDVDLDFDDGAGMTADNPSHEALVIEARGGNDVLSAAGGSGTGAAHSVPTSFIMGAGNHTITGGAALTDRVNYSGAGASVDLDFTRTPNTATVATATPTTDNIVDVERATGSPFDDKLFGHDVDNRFDGGDGNDLMAGRLGADEFRGDAGVDTVDYSLQTTASTETGCGSGVVVDLGSTTSDVLSGSGSCGHAQGDNPKGSVENIIGTQFDDVLSGSQAANKIEGRAGNDEIAGESGGDHLIGGAGNSAIQGGSGNDVIEGGDGNDDLFGDDDDDLIKPGGGTDLVAGDDGSGNELGSSDTIDFSNAPNGVLIDLSATAAYDTGNGAKEIIEFENAVGSNFNDSIFGNDDGNVLTGGLGNDSIDGVGGGDTSDYSGAPSAVIVDLAATAPHTSGGHGNDTLVSIETIVGSNFNDVLRGGPGGDTLRGGKGNDTIEGRDGDDTLDGGEPAEGEDPDSDTVEYRSASAAVRVDLSPSPAPPLPQDTDGAGMDVLTGFENLVGSAHDDTLTGDGFDNIIEGLNGADTINGDAGSDTASYRSAASAVNVDLQRSGADESEATGGAGNDQLSNIESITGSAHNDTFRGTATANVFTGLGGTDTLTYSEREENLTLRANGKAVSGEADENDTIHADVENLIGGSGNDLLAGASGVDNLLSGGAGTDTADYGESPNAIAADLVTGKVVGASTDTLSSIENVFGSNHADTLIGNSGNNELRGQGGSDTIRGEGGNDILRGGTGNDTFYEGASPNGADVINGDLGFDTVDYSDRTGSVTATFEGTANDGAPGENDNLISIESVLRPGSGTVAPTGFGYWLVAADGGIFAFGDAGFFGSTGALTLNQPIVGMTPTASGNGYWFVASDGGIFAFGDAGFFGSMGGTPLNQPIVGMEVTPSGNGYWLVAADGGIFAFGDAGFFGSTGDITLNQPIVGMTSTSSGAGYWFVASDGGIFAYGDAKFAGSMGGTPLNQPIVGMDATPSGGGYWLVASDGGIFAFGDAPFHGSTGALTLNQPIVGMTRTASGAGYWFVASDGGIFAFGDAGFAGSMGGTPLNQPIVGMAALS